MSQVRAYLELFRLPNVFTAVADVVMGYLVTHPPGSAPMPIECVVLAIGSSLLYTAGMVLNDVYDAKVDAAERPHRPIPSGRISVRFATWLGYQLLAMGVVCGWIAAQMVGNARPGLVATALAAAIVAYDALLKKTLLAPLGMGACRFLNVALGMSAAAVMLDTPHALIAAGIGVYIVGVTWFSRSEAEHSHRQALIGSLVVMLVGMGLLAWAPFYGSLDGEPSRLFPYVERLGNNWWLLWGLLALSIAYRAVLAINDPSSGRVQQAVKHSIMSLVVLDAAVTAGGHGVVVATGVLLLLIPARLLGRWVYST